MQSSITSPPVRKTIIGSCKQKDVAALDWIGDVLPEWDTAIYVVDGHANDSLTVAKNKGREAAVYLTYIINHYYDLPDYMVFIHGLRYQNHNDEPMYDTFPLIANLNLDHVDTEEYVPLKCAHADGCPKAYVHPNADPNHKDGRYEWSGLYASAFSTFFPDREIPSEIVAPCCAQFAVSREAVLKVPVSTYDVYRQWMWDSQPENFEEPQGSHSLHVGLVMEYMWHLIFGKPSHFCPTDIGKCYCDTWGFCGLECTEHECKGRTWHVESTEAHPKLPKNWPEEGQGVDGWPVEGWWNNNTEWPPKHDPWSKREIYTA